MEYHLIILIGAIAIGLLESLIFKLWCNRQQLRFSSFALFAVILGAILGSYGGAIIAGGIASIAPQALMPLLLNIFCKGDAGAFGICLWFAAVISIVLSAGIGSLLGGWLGFRLWLSMSFS